MIKMNISLTGVKEFEGSLDRIRDVVSDFTPELRDIGEWYIDFLQNDVFETEGGVIGENWPSLSPKYAERKAKKYPGRGILEASGRMRTSWKLYTAAQYALITNEAEYAKYHQQDPDSGYESTGRIPRRMFVKFDQQRQDHINSMFSEGILKRIQNAVR